MSLMLYPEFKRNRGATFSVGGLFPQDLCLVLYVLTSGEMFIYGMRTRVVHLYGCELFFIYGCTSGDMYFSMPASEILWLKVLPPALSARNQEASVWDDFAPLCLISYIIVTFLF